ncbi:hypothetical protein Cyagr_2051 [Cyanobium gracile PCC 6307]|uniref:Endonuclease/exonuclease/phosphatase domain-containing protein n=2 Tax=Cyanobium gracile TaxID=59930 RepID=K9P6Y8_CYAGP|nr:hypothetical protein Cyagr_2051 [Cyanobium gracile PCC 6307]
MHSETANIPQFKNLLNGEQIICLQEVGDIQGTRDQYHDYPYVFTATNETTKGRTQHVSIMILSKFPIESYASKIIQIDPGGDEWKRNAQYAVLKVGTSQRIHLFHYHNTYNWHYNNSASERSGFMKFVDWVKECLNVPDFAQTTNLVLAGDFNLWSTDVAPLIQGLNYSYNNFVDYVCGSMALLDRGLYPTNGSISDHDAVWANLEVDNINMDAVVGPEVTIYNLAHSEYLYAADHKPFDDDRRRVFTWRPGGSAGSHGNWRLEPVSDGVVRIFNTYQLEYLYAADYKPFDDDRRHVFTWRPGNPVNQGYWRIDDMGDLGKRIYNLHQGEYLYAADYKPFDNDRRHVFTWRPGNPVNQGYWRIG